MYEARTLNATAPNCIQQYQSREYIFVFASFSVRLCVYSLLWLKFGDKMQILTIISPSRKTRAFCNYVLLMAGWFCG